MSATNGDAANPELSRAAEDLLFACFDAEDVDEAVERTCAANPAIAKKIRKVYARLRDFGLTPDDTTTPSGRVAVALPGRELPPKVASHEIRELVGEGGMGVVYRAWNEKLGREVAIKFIRPRLVHLTGKRLRFQREIEAIARLSHPNIVPILEVGESEGIPWFAMEFVTGASLADMLKALKDVASSGLSASAFFAATRSPDATPGSAVTDRQLRRSWNDACLEIVVQTARALEHAHARGVLHRDVKPSNIMVTPDGRALLLDFGLARTEDEHELALTQSTSEIGSLPYMAPELLRGNAIPNPRLDVYGLGVTLYEVLARTNPYLDSTAEGTRARVLEGNAKALRKINPQIPWDLETVCMTAMAPESERRYPNMAAFLGDLERLQNKLPIRAKRASTLLRMRRWQQRHPVFSAGLLTALVALAIGALVLWMQARRARDNAVRLEQIAREQTMRSERMLQGTQLAFARALVLGRNPLDARRALERISEDERGWIWHHLERMTDMSLLTHKVHSQAFRFVVLPDEQRMVTTNVVDGAFLVEITTGEKQKLEMPKCKTLALSVDGRLLVGSTKDTDEIFVYDLEERRLKRRFAAQGFLSTPQFGATNESIVAISAAGSIRFWALEADEAAPRIVREWKAHEPRGRAPMSLFWRDAARTQLFTIQSLDALKCWSNDGTLRYTIPNRHAPIAAARVTGDAKTLVIAHASYFTRSRRRMTAWNAETGARLWSWRPENRGTVLELDAAGEMFAMGNRTVEIVSTKTRDVLGRMIGNLDTMIDLKWLSDGRVLTADQGGRYRLWQPDRLAHQTKYAAHEGSVTALLVLEGDRVLSASTRGVVALGDCRGLEVLRQTQLEKTRVQAILHGRPGEAVVVQKDGSVHVIASQELTKLRRATIGESAAQSVRIDETRVLVLAASGVLHIVDHVTGMQSKRRIGEADWTTLSYDAGQVLLASPKGTIAVWKGTIEGASLASIQTPSVEIKLEGEGFVSSALSAVNARALAGTSKGKLFWIDTESGAILQRFHGHSAHLGQIAMSADAERLYSVAWNGTMKAWHPELDEALLFVSPGRSMLLSLALHPDGDFLAVGGLDGKVQMLWGKPRSR